MRAREYVSGSDGVRKSQMRESTILAAGRVDAKMDHVEKGMFASCVILIVSCL